MIGPSAMCVCVSTSALSVFNQVVVPLCTMQCTKAGTPDSASLVSRHQMTTCTHGKAQR